MAAGESRVVVLNRIVYGVQRRRTPGVARGGALLRACKRRGSGVLVGARAALFGLTKLVLCHWGHDDFPFKALNAACQPRPSAIALPEAL